MPLRPNPSINIIGSGFDWKGLKTWFGFQWKNNRSKQLRFLTLILLTWCLTQFSLLALRVKVQGRKGQLKRGQSNCFLIKSITCIKWSIFFFTDIIHQVWKIFHFSFLIYFLTRINMYVKVIFKVQFSLSSLLSHYAVTSYARALSLSKTFSSTAPNWVTQPAAYSQGHLRWSSEVPAHLCICLSLYLSVLVSFSLFLGAQWYIGRSTLTLNKSQWKRVLKESRRISVTFFS